MNKLELITLLKDRGIITSNNKRKFCWKKLFTDDVKIYFDEFAKKYRSDEEAWFCLLNNVEPYKCEVCGNLAVFTGSRKSKIKGYNTVCENCSANKSNIKLTKYFDTINKRSDEDKEKIFLKRKQTNLEKYGDENYTLYGSAKFRETMLEKYGDEYYNNNEKTKRTNLERYGVECNLQLISGSEHSKKVWDEQHDKILEKRNNTNLERYGCEHVGQSTDIQHKMSITKSANISLIETNYNCINVSKLVKLYGQGWKALNLPKIQINNYTFISNEYIEQIKDYTTKERTIISYASKKEKELFNYIKSIYNGTVLENVTNVVSNKRNRFYELDIYLPDLKIAFDFNGSYWHSILYKDKYYHQRKLKRCYEHGIQMINIYEYDWDANKAIVKRKIQELLTGQDCSKYNWINVNDYENYKLSKPNKIDLNLLYNINFVIYDEGKFIHK